MPDSKAPVDGKIRLKYWMVSAMKEQPFHVTEFNRTHHNIIVEPTPLPWSEHEKKIHTSILSEDPPDLVFLVTPVAKWATRLALTPLDDLIKRDSFDSSIFFSALWNEMRFKDKIYALPLYSNSYAFFYNKKLFAEEGLQPRKTWDELIETSKRLTTPDRYGMELETAPDAYSIFTFYPFLWAAGGRTLNDDWTKSEINSPAAISAFQLWQTQVLRPRSSRS